ncbi:MAG: hypothetical protein JJD98_14095, partial [Polaromonas sp.]|nr:hypothetical protein [Polaromonas sp.]
MMSSAPPPDSKPPPADAGQSVDALPVMDQPYVLPPPVGPQALMVALGPLDPFRWLAAGWRDLVAHLGIGLFYGLCFWLMAITLA